MSPLRLAVPVAGGAIYGGYFGAGLGVILLAVLGLVLDETLTRLNALKQAIALAANLAAAIFFLSSGEVAWLVALVMGVGAIVGGTIGGRLAGRIKPATLRAIVVTVAVIVAAVYLIRGLTRPQRRVRVIQSVAPSMPTASSIQAVAHSQAGSRNSVAIVAASDGPSTR